MPLPAIAPTIRVTPAHRPQSAAGPPRPVRTPSAAPLMMPSRPHGDGPPSPPWRSSSPPSAASSPRKTCPAPCRRARRWIPIPSAAPPRRNCWSPSPRRRLRPRGPRRRDRSAPSLRPCGRQPLLLPLRRARDRSRHCGPRRNSASRHSPRRRAPAPRPGPAGPRPRTLFVHALRSLGKAGQARHRRVSGRRICSHPLRRRCRRARRTSEAPRCARRICAPATHRSARCLRAPRPWGPVPMRRTLRRRR